jgi:hypothetical protein
LLLIYVNSEPFSALIGVFSILLCLAKLVNQYYNSSHLVRLPATSTCTSFSSASSKLCLPLHISYYTHQLLPVLPSLSSLYSGMSSPYSYFLDSLWSGTHVLTPQPLVSWKSYSAQCYSTSSFQLCTYYCSLNGASKTLNALDNFPDAVSNPALFFTLSLFSDPSLALYNDVSVCI